MRPLSTPLKESWLGWFFRGLIILGMLLLIGRLAELQIIKGDYYKTLADENRIRRVPITAPRGRILDTNGNEIVGNRMVKKRVVFGSDKGYEKLSSLTDAKEEEIIEEPVRLYYIGEQAAHISGYIGEVNEDEVGKVRPDCTNKGPLQLGGFVGRSGLEQEYDCTLSGIDGEELVEVDTSGKRIRTLGRKNPTPGSDIETNIDIDLQKKVASTMKDKKGAAVVTDGMGNILALYSSPSYDPNAFVNGDSKVEHILKDSNLPLFNRAISGTYPPGSVVKPIVATAALVEGAISPSYEYEDTGSVVVNEYQYTNWYYTQYGGKEGLIDVVKALARSTDTFFYKTGEKLGIDNIVTWYEKYGFGEKTGIDLPNEEEGLVPSPEWKESIKGERWFLGNTYHVSIGQGDLLVTPIQLHNAILSVANMEKCNPEIASLDSKKCEETTVEDSIKDVVLKGMIGACSTGGTGYTFFDFKPASLPVERTVACKTGTAETYDKGDPHAWFSVMAPVDNPEIVATVLVEQGGEGSKVAGPVAREIFDHWFGKSAK